MAGMTIERLEQMISERGGDLSLWQESDRREVERFMRESQDAKNLVDEMGAIEIALASIVAPEASHDLKSKILADASELLAPPSVVNMSANSSEDQVSLSLIEAVWSSFADLLAPWARQVAAMLVVALVGGVVAGAWVSAPSVDHETLVAAYGADIDYWMTELDPAGMQVDGGET